VGSLFFLDKKEAKNQEPNDASTHRQNAMARRLVQAYARKNAPERWRVHGCTACNCKID